MLFQSTAYGQNGILGNVFLDENSNGIEEADEEPIANVTILLQDENSNLLAATISSSDGFYVFENLPEIVGNFIVSVVLPNGTFCTTSVFEVVQYEDGEAVELDFGLNYITDLPPGLIAGLVWYDINYNNVYDDGEEGFETEIILKTEAGFYIEAVMSDSETGAYIFDNVVDGTYILEAETSPTGSTLISPQQVEVTVEDGVASANTYFGFQPIESTNIDLKVTSSAPFNTILGYEFDYILRVNNDDGNDLATGVQVKSVLPDELEFVEFITLDGTYDWNTGIWTCDDVDVQFGSSYFIMRVKAVAEGNIEWKAELIAADQFDPDSTPNNMGESPIEDDESIIEVYATEYGSIGDMVWFDENGNGIQDSNEMGIPGVTMYLYDENGDVIATTLTDDNGEYLFDELVDGTYTVVVGDGPEGTILTTLPSYSATILFIEVIHAELGDFGFKEVDETEVIDLEVGINGLAETVGVGELESYKVFIENNGSGNASGIEVAVTLPDNLNYVNAYSVLGGYNPATGIWSIGSLVAGGYVELTVLVEGTQEGNAEIIVEVVDANESDVDSTPDNMGDAPVEDDEGVAYILVVESDTEFIDLEAGINLAIETVEVGETVTYHIFVGNNLVSDETATGVEVSVLLSSNNFSYVSHNTSSGSYDLSTGIWTVGTIQSGAYEDLNLTLEATNIGNTEIIIEVVNANETDIDSTPNNLGDVAVEDDEGIFYISIQDTIIKYVWPGDANDDGIANNQDLLNVGLAFNQMGIARESISTEWIGQTCDNWTFYFENEVNLKHADCDGSGLVDNLDVEAINLNYGLVHGKTEDENEANEDDPLLILDFPDDSFQTGDILEIPIRLGDMENVLEGLYGIAFSIEFEEGLFIEESIEIDFSGSWLGMENDDLLTIDKLIDGHVVDVALCRNNQIDVSGGGQLAVMRGIIDDIAGKEDFLEFDFSLKNVKAVMADETDVPIFYEEASIAVGSDGTTVGAVNLGTNTRLYPNPTTDVFNLEFDTNHLPKSVAFYGVDGRAIKIIDKVTSDISVDVSAWKSGIYFVEIVFESESIWRKVIVE